MDHKTISNRIKELLEKKAWYIRFRRYRMSSVTKRNGAKYWDDRDSKDNASGRLPQDENVEIPAIWVAELYTPSTINGLLCGIKELGWEFGKTENTSLTEWMKNVREGRLAGYNNLGLVSPPGTTEIMSDRFSTLPSGVKAAFPILMSLTPSLTAFIIGFLLEDSTAKSLESPLRKIYQTRINWNPRFRHWHLIRYILWNGPIHLSQQIFSPDLLRRNTVISLIQEIENSCIQWVKSNVPGFFSSLSNQKNPTAALFVTGKAKPLSDDTKKLQAFRGLGIDVDIYTWESDEWPGAKLVIPWSRNEDENRLVFACRRRDAFPEGIGYYDPTSNWTITHRANEYIRGLLSRWAISCLLDSYHETLSVLRDKSAYEDGYRPIRDLKELRSLSRTTLYDIVSCTNEVMKFVKDDRYYNHDIIELYHIRKSNGNKSELLDELKRLQSKRAKQVQSEAKLLQSTLSTCSHLSHIILPKIRTTG